jgi:hypothetical protein
MSPGDAPEPNLPATGRFGHLQVSVSGSKFRKRKVVVTNKNKTQAFWIFDLSFPQSPRCVGSFCDTVVGFSLLGTVWSS